MYCATSLPILAILDIVDTQAHRLFIFFKSQYHNNINMQVRRGHAISGRMTNMEHECGYMEINVKGKRGRDEAMKAKEEMDGLDST